MSAGRLQPKSRQIVEADLPALARLLHAGFPERTLAYWTTALDRLRTRVTPEDYPRYGQVLECGGELVGVLLLIFSRPGGKEAVRCNVSSWYVQPAFRSFAALLTSAALRHKAVTYVNVSPAPNTWPILEAQGYRRFCDGLVIAAPALARPRPGVRVQRVSPIRATSLGYGGLEEVLSEPLRPDALVFRIEAGDARVPFVFVPDGIKKMHFGVARLAWTPEPDSFARWAGPLGRALLLAGYPVLLLDGDGRRLGFPGRFFRDRQPKYAKGPCPPRLNDLSHTEALLFG